MYENRFAIITGNVTLEANTSENVGNNVYKHTVWGENYPEGFTKDNCVIVSFVSTFNTETNNGYYYGYIPDGNKSQQVASGNVPAAIKLEDGVINCRAFNFSTNTKTLYYKIVLLKTN